MFHLPHPPPPPSLLCLVFTFTIVVVVKLVMAYYKMFIGGLSYKLAYYAIV